jgi:hypothetical protein
MEKINSPFISTIKYSLIGIVVGLLVIFFEEVFHLGDSITLAGALPTIFVTWIVSIIMKVCIWFAFIPSCYAIMLKLLPLTGTQTIKQSIIRSKKYFFYVIALILLLYIGMFKMADKIPDENGINHTILKNVYLLNIIGFFIFAFPFICISLIMYSADQLKRKHSYNLGDYFLLREKFQSVILILGVFLSLVVLTVTFQQQANLKIKPESVIGYGLLHAFIMLVIYVAGKINLISYGVEIRAHHLQNIKKSDEYIDTYKKLTDTLALDQSFKKDFINILSVLSPLLTGTLLPLVIKQIGDIK